MYHGLFVCIINDYYGLELCTMYDSHGVYLRILWTIYMYKFSRCHVIIFTVFSFHLPIFSKNHPVSDKIRPEIVTSIFEKTGRFIGETSRISVFPVFTAPPPSSICFGRIFHVFAEFFEISDFFEIFKKPT
jgi:hypothetical protein